MPPLPEFTALIISVIREFDGMVLISVVILFAIVMKVFNKFFGD